MTFSGTTIYLDMGEINFFLEWNWMLTVTAGGIRHILGCLLVLWYVLVKVGDLVAGRFEGGLLIDQFIKRSSVAQPCCKIQSQ